MPDNRARSSHRVRQIRRRVAAQRPPCWLCSQPIDYELRFPHAGSFSIDHVVPVRQGGDEYDLENIRAAHLRCNQQRGDGRRALADVPARPTPGRPRDPRADRWDELEKVKGSDGTVYGVIPGENFITKAGQRAGQPW